MNDLKCCATLQIIGLHEKAEKDEVVKAVLVLKNSEVEEGYTADALKSRQVIYQTKMLYLT